jgi:hypothetical protein
VYSHPGDSMLVSFKVTAKGSKTKVTKEKNQTKEIKIYTSFDMCNSG